MSTMKASDLVRNAADVRSAADVTTARTFVTYVIGPDANDITLPASPQNGDVVIFDVTDGFASDPAPRILPAAGDTVLGDSALTVDVTHVRIPLTYRDGDWEGASTSVGLRGDPPNLAIGTVDATASGGAPAATITGSSPDYSLNLVLPRGDKGDTGSVAYASLLAGGTLDIGLNDAPVARISYVGNRFFIAPHDGAGNFDFTKELAFNPAEGFWKIEGDLRVGGEMSAVLVDQDRNYAAVNIGPQGAGDAPVLRISYDGSRALFAPTDGAGAFDFGKEFFFDPVSGRWGVEGDMTVAGVLVEQREAVLAGKVMAQNADLYFGIDGSDATQANVAPWRFASSVKATSLLTVMTSRTPSTGTIVVDLVQGTTVIATVTLSGTDFSGSAPIPFVGEGLSLFIRIRNNSSRTGDTVINAHARLVMGE